MGNAIIFQAKKTSEEFVEQRKLRVRIGLLCFDFVPCSHFVEIEGIEGWVAYTSPMIVSCFVKNPERFYIDSKFMPELEIERPGVEHFDIYNTPNRHAIDPERVLDIHKKGLQLTGSLISEFHT